MQVGVARALTRRGQTNRGCLTYPLARHPLHSPLLPHSPARPITRTLTNTPRMVVTRKSSAAAAPVPSRTNTSQNRPPQLRDNQNLDILDPFARANGRPIPPQFADNVQYVVRAERRVRDPISNHSAQKPTKSTLASQPALQRQVSAPPSPSKSKSKKKKAGQVSRARQAWR